MREIRFLDRKWLDTMHWTSIGVFLLCHSYSKLPNKTEDYFLNHAIKNGIVIC